MWEDKKSRVTQKINKKHKVNKMYRKYVSKPFVAF